ncbi:MAG: hypothetical protein DA408_05475 [Bacteroidetes bacterium]|nr:MAG: hypothetical protein C7N36_02350 [Bacteroidota bacterium]PTM13747.1 MAG: hypothetical protein DA408_05475 [Bacteroidota bacterium]
MYLLLLYLLGTACAPYTKSDLAGKWQVLSLTEDGDSLAVDLALINFQFSEDGYYHFNSTLNYEESGTYRLNGPFLYSTDTLDSPHREKAVKIVLLRNDSLVLKMEEMGRERLVVLRREK